MGKEISIFSITMITKYFTFIRKIIDGLKKTFMFYDVIFQSILFTNIYAHYSYDTLILKLCKEIPPKSTTMYFVPGPDKAPLVSVFSV